MDLLGRFARAIIQQLDPPPPPPQSDPAGLPPPPPPTSSNRYTQNTVCDTVCHNPEHIQDWHSNEIQQYFSLCSGKQCSWVVPFAGNAFVTSSSSNHIAPPQNLLNSDGIGNWNDPKTKVSLYVHCVQTGSYLIGLRLRVPGGGSAKIKLSITTCSNSNVCGMPQLSEIVVYGNPYHHHVYQIIRCGMFSVPQAGYIKFELEGLQRSGPVFADISHAIVIPDDHEASSRGKRSVHNHSDCVPEKSCLKFVADPEDFYFGRRGPSVHLNYEIPGEAPPQIEYFYNEVLVPPGQDVVGAYFCAIGFSGGYFGIQVNSGSERRILFSIWSAYDTDNPQDIPQDFKVTLVRKGSPDVHVGEFGNEGSGGQSYLRYLWKSGISYKFLVQAKPLDENNTLFSAWICDTGNSSTYDWRLIASFRKPKVSTHLQGLYSFSENFLPEMGHVERVCTFGNQWAIDTNGKLMEITKASFSADATAAKENRKDVAAGITGGGSDGRFYLRNCGFFSDTVNPGESFCRSACGRSPSINVRALP